VIPEILDHRATKTEFLSEMQSYWFETSVSSRKPIGVGEILREEFLDPSGMEVSVLCVEGLREEYWREVLEGDVLLDERGALRLSEVFGNTYRFWINLKRHEELWERYYGKNSSQ